MKTTKSQITQEMIDAVFSDPKLRKKFANPSRAESICEMRLTGATYDEIAEKHKVSNGHCVRTVDKLRWLHQLYGEVEQT